MFGLCDDDTRGVGDLAPVSVRISVGGVTYCCRMCSFVGSFGRLLACRLLNCFFTAAAYL